MENDVKQEVSRQHRWKKGESGNPKGRPVAPEAVLLRKALKVAHKEKNMHFLEHFVRLAYENPQVAIALAKKLIPDLHRTEGDVLDLKQYIIIRNPEPSPEKANS